jgi:hypothetical protein
VAAAEPDTDDLLAAAAGGSGSRASTAIRRLPGGRIAFPLGYEDR